MSDSASESRAWSQVAAYVSSAVLSSCPDCQGCKPARVGQQPKGLPGGHHAAAARALPFHLQASPVPSPGVPNSSLNRYVSLQIGRCEKQYMKHFLVYVEEQDRKSELNEGKFILLDLE